MAQCRIGQLRADFRVVWAVLTRRQHQLLLQYTQPTRGAVVRRRFTLTPSDVTERVVIAPESLSRMPQTSDGDGVVEDMEDDNIGAGIG